MRSPKSINFGEPSRSAQQVNAGALAHQVHHGGRGDGPFGPFNVVGDVAGCPAQRAALHVCRCAYAQASAMAHQHADAVAMSAVTLIALLCLAGLLRVGRVQGVYVIVLVLRSMLV